MIMITIVIPYSWGCLNSMSCMKHFCRYIGSTESISMTGAGLVQYMVRLQTVSGAADESVPVNMVCRKFESDE